MPDKRVISWFMASWLLVSVAVLLAVLLTEKLDLHAAMHPFHSEALDAFFLSVTHVGDGLVPLALSLLILAFRDIRSFLLMGLGCGFSAIVVQLLKRGPFASVDRPYMFKEQLGAMHWVPGLELHHHFSFPSGHSTAVFSMCFALAVFINRPTWSVAVAFLAILVAYSRVYLSQHFTEDILVGAALGTLTSYMVYRWLYLSGFSKRPWLDRRLGHFPK